MQPGNVHWSPKNRMVTYDGLLDAHNCFSVNPGEGIFLHSVINSEAKREALGLTRVELFSIWAWETPVRTQANLTSQSVFKSKIRRMSTYGFCTSSSNFFHHGYKKEEKTTTWRVDKLSGYFNRKFLDHKICLVKASTAHFVRFWLKSVGRNVNLCKLFTIFFIRFIGKSLFVIHS